ncbi:Alpha/Beta hydrolase protein [Kockovaella imperatae]|uniref:Alpha/Beta hydrolase protein n=1 Tax=Kockovaella imperatae TaxID=4999 RepID=A0A1Y1UDN1_9TREE|nr:Alpha/Beta hydrolase protein [Kockovaella imperatae]ORX36112.1 Alpha/Beta hydrolase protein [Kockovaella imperatae]
MDSTFQRPREPPQPLKHLLQNYTTSHPLRSPSPLPASSRVDPKLTQRLPPAASNPLFWTIPTWIAFVRFAIAKGIYVIWSLVMHFLRGPVRRSWGYRMTFITSFMRNVADYTSLADIVLIRRLISLSFLIPLPADAVVTPITFLVPRHTGPDVARGFLRELDSIESGNRELSGEWVVGTDVWKRLKAEKRARKMGRGTLPGKRSNSSTPLAGGQQSDDTPTAPVPASMDMDNGSEYGSRDRGSPSERVIYYIHGGAYYVGNAATHRLITIGVSKACNARVFAITYRLAPENVFPLPLHDVLHGYLRLLAPPLSIPPENIIIAGDSAGGGMSLALCMYLRDEGYKMPSGLILMSPWVDLTMSCGSWDECSAWDVVPRPTSDDHLNPVLCYLGQKGVINHLTHPYASPLFGDLHDLPPMLIQAGDSEVLRDEITLLAHKATLAGVDVTHELYEDMVHVFQMFTFLPAAKVAINSIGRWVRTVLPRIEDEKSRKAAKDVGDGVDGETDSPVSRTVREKSSTLNRSVGRSHGFNQPPPPRLEEQRRRSSAFNSLHLVARAPTSDQPSVDVDSLPTSGSRSGSPTPTGSPLFPTIPDPSSSHLHTTHAPQLRRALTAAAITSSANSSPANSPPRPGRLRPRRRTQGAGSLHLSSPSTSTTPSNSSNPVSPSPSIRPRLRSPSSASQPTARHRSQSHSDIFSLVEGYVEGGAANETVVYAPGGEVRSVGVLGEDEDEEE